MKTTLSILKPAGLGDKVTHSDAGGFAGLKEMIIRQSVRIAKYIMTTV
jgi:hypothetical protein